MPGLHLQVLRGDSCRPPPQGHPPRSQDQLDVPPRDEAQGAARPHRQRQELPRPGQGAEVHPDHRRLQARVLAQEELPQDPQEALSNVSFFYFSVINFLHRGVFLCTVIFSVRIA